MKLVFTIALLFELSAKISQGQIEEERYGFFIQRIELLKNEYSKQLPIKISARILQWDTTDYVFTRFFSRYDTTEINDLNIKSKPVRMKIVNMMKELTAEDYLLIREQIKNQFTESVIKESVLLNTQAKKKRAKATIYFSQPLIVNNANTIFLKEKIKYTDGYEYYQCAVYKKLSDKWEMVTLLESSAFVID